MVVAVGLGAVATTPASDPVKNVPMLAAVVAGIRPRAAREVLVPESIGFRSGSRAWHGRRAVRHATGAAADEAVGVRPGVGIERETAGAFLARAASKAPVRREEAMAPLAPAAGQPVVTFADRAGIRAREALRWGDRSLGGGFRGRAHATSLDSRSAVPRVPRPGVMTLLVEPLTPSTALPAPPSPSLRFPTSRFAPAGVNRQGRRALTRVGMASVMVTPA